MEIKKGDFVEIDFTGKIKDGNHKNQINKVHILIIWNKKNLNQKNFIKINFKIMIFIDRISHFQKSINKNFSEIESYKKAIAEKLRLDLLKKGNISIEQQ